MTIKVRRATMKDLKRVQELNLALFIKEIKDFDPTLDMSWTYGKFGAKYFKDRIQNKNFGGIWVAFVEEKCIGYLAGGVTKVKSSRKLFRMAELENTFVEPAFRSKGVGRKLFKEFLSWCKKYRVERIRVVASAQNKKAIHFYRNYGFKDYDLILESDLK